MTASTLASLVDCAEVSVAAVNEMKASESNKAKRLNSWSGAYRGSSIGCRAKMRRVE
jgi:hypothetical protein